MSNLIPIQGQPFLKKDSFTKAILNCNVEKLNTSKTLIDLKDKYILMEKKIQNIDSSLSDIKLLLIKLTTEKNN